MIEIILPCFVVSTDTFGDSADGMLFPEEEAIIGQAGGKRRREFTTMRVCAREALKMLGRSPAPVLSGAQGEPRWPDGIVGSMTHCAGYRGVALGEHTKVTAIGIDAEPDEPLPYGVLNAIALPEEQDDIQTLLRAHPGVHWDRLLFSAKESVYKAWFSLMNQWLSFEDTRVTVDPFRGTFSAHLLVDGPQVHGKPLTGFSGRWLASQGLLLTAIVLPTPASPTPPSA